MKICFICSEYPPALNGGIGTFVKELAENLVAEGHQIKVIGLYPGESQIEIINGVEIHRIGKSKIPLFWILDLLRLRRLIKEWDKKQLIDLVEDNDWESQSAVFGSLNVPLVLRIHNRFLAVAGSLNEFGRLRKFKFLGALKRATSIVGVSQNIVDSLHELAPLKEQARVIYNGVRVGKDRIPVIKRNQNQAMFAGTLVEEKGIVKLIDGWLIVLKEIPHARLVVFGKDQIDKSGNSMISKLQERLGNYEAQVHFMGHVNKEVLNHHYQTSMVFVSPSFFEAFSLTPLEAMAHGCPTVYTKLTSGPEAITHERDGLLVDPNSEHEIANAILKLFQNPEESEALSKNGYKRVTENFDVMKKTDENLDLYNSLVDDNGH
ncbi:glycosyltransferase family 4 protein [Akkermansiaceae bacterium]|nr:glycosyltransferase family 4 protein [Akkermansiaceae bacterium]